MYDYIIVIHTCLLLKNVPYPYGVWDYGYVSLSHLGNIVTIIETLTLKPVYVYIYSFLSHNLGRSSGHNR